MAARHSVYRPGPGRIWGFRALVALIIIGSLYLAFELGRMQAGHNLLEAASERQAFRSEIAGLEDRIRGLEEEIARLETNRQIDADSYQQVEESLSDLQAKIREQDDALAFYRGIVSPADGGRGLRIQQFSVATGRDERTVTASLVLVQAMRHDRRVSGSVVLEIAGQQNGEERTYSWSDLRPESEQEAWNFSFRYFQDFERELVLPDGFSPDTVNIEIRSRTRSVDSIVENFEWSAVRS